MSSNFKDLTVSKVEMARLQLDAAIVAYFNDQKIVAITLAGAAEEILGKMLNRKKMENSVEKIASLSPMLAISPDPNKCISWLNQPRNNLKHAADEVEDNFVISELDDFFMIARALGNASLLGIDDSEQMAKFRKENAPKV